MPNLCICTRKCYPECPSSAAALHWRQVGAALPPCHGYALGSEIPHYIPEGPHSAPSMRLSQPDSVGRGWEGLHLHLNVGAYISRGISLGSPHRREIGKITVFVLLPISPPRVLAASCPNSPPVPPYSQDSCQWLLKAHRGAAGGNQRLVPTVFFHQWPLMTMVRCRDVQYRFPALLVYFVPMYELDTFSNLLSENLYWMCE